MSTRNIRLPVGATPPLPRETERPQSESRPKLGLRSMRSSDVFCASRTSVNIPMAKLFL
jgi:hypothetical protein